MKTYFESLLFFFLFPLEGGTLELWRGKRANFLKKVKFSSLDSSSSLHSFLSLSLSLSHITTSTRAQTITKGRTLPPNARRVCSKASAFCRAWWCEDTASCDRNARASSGDIFFSFWSFRERKGRQEEEGEEEEAKDKNFGTREEKNHFFFKKRELERTRDSAKNVAHFSSARFCLNEKQTEKENAATKMMARAMRAGRFDFRERIIDFFFEEVRLVFYSSFFGKKREREREREKSTREDKKNHRGEVSEFFCSTTTPPFFDENVKKENFFSFLSSAHENKNANCRFFKR